MKNYHLVALFLFVFVSCNNKIDIEYAKQRRWMYQKGYKVAGDGIVFNNNDFDIKAPNIILYKDTARAEIISINKQTNEMKIVSISTKEVGVYVDSKEFTTGD